MKRKRKRDTEFERDNFTLQNVVDLKRRSG